VSRILRDTERRDVAWKNGLGTTRDILERWVPGRELGHRLSLATIARDAAFSLYPRIDRTIVLAEGAGFVLAFADGARAEVTPAAPVASFAGELPAQCTLLCGPVRALNVMTAREAARHSVAVRRLVPGETVTASPVENASCVIVCLEGELRLSESRLARFDAAELGAPASLTGAGLVALVTLSALC
jgi:uncharacterized protein